MDSYGYPYGAPYPAARAPDREYPDHGDGFADYYGSPTINEDWDANRRNSRTTHRVARRRRNKRSRSRSVSANKTRNKSQSRSASRSNSRHRSRSRSGSRTRSRSKSGSRHRELNYKEPGFLDAFKVLYLTPSKQKKSTSKFLVTKKRQDRIHEILKSDGLGSKRWLFYPRSKDSGTPQDPTVGEVAGSRDNSDQRVKIDAEFFRKYKRRSKVDADAPIAKLKRWELIFYKKLGFLQAV